jgi:predicted amidohydrolase
MLRIALVQMRCEKAAVSENIRVIENHIEEAEKRGIDVIGFPEMSITWGGCSPIISLQFTVGG